MMRANSFINRIVVALVSFSLVLSMVGASSPAMADVVGEESTPASGEPANGLVNDPVQEEVADPPLQDEGEDQDAAPEGDDPIQDDANDPPLSEGGDDQSTVPEGNEPVQETGDDVDVPDNGTDVIDNGKQNNAPDSSRNGVGINAVDVSTVSVTVTMLDGGLVPSGLEAWLYPSGIWDPIEVVPLTYDGTTATATFTGDIPYETYAVWVIGNGYSRGQTVKVDTPEEQHAFTLDRLTGTIEVTMNTSDGADVPAGTSWSLSHTQDGVVAGDTMATSLPNGSLLPLPTDPLQFGTYELTFSPPAVTTGRYVEPETITINLTNTREPDQSVIANLDIVVPTATVGLSVAMSDGGAIPFGLEWSLVTDGWVTVASGPVTPGGTIFLHEIEQPIPYGSYQLWITGNGYSAGQVLTVKSDEVSHGFTLNRIFGTLSISLTSPDGADIPAGTGWQILDANDQLIQSGSITEPLPSGSVLIVPEPLEFGVYTLNIGSDPDTLVPWALADLPRELLPFTTTVNVNNPWFSEYTIDAPLQWAVSDINFTVSMSDGGPLPNGLEWMLVLSGSWDPLASGDVPAGEISYAGTVGEPVPYGTYQLWVTGNGYSSGQVLNVNSETTPHNVVFNRLTGEVTVTLDTSNDAEIPAGTTWSITDSAGTVVQSGELTDATAPGGVLPLTNPLEFDVYTLAIDADGYFPFSMEMNITNSWISEYAFTATLQEELSEITFTVSMSDGEGLPNGLEWSLVPSGSWDPIESGDVTAGEILFAGQVTDLVPFGSYQLWITGHGYSSGQVLNVNSAETHHDFVLDRLLGEVTVTLDTTDDADISAGTTWSISDSAGTVVQYGVLNDAIADGGSLPLTNPLEFDVYTLTIDADGYLPFSMVMSITNPWVSDYALTAELLQELSAISFTVSMSDDGLLPNGLEWTLVASGSEEPLDSGQVTAGETLFADSAEDRVPNGEYELWITGHGYRSGQVLIINSSDRHHDFVLDRLYADVTVVLNTSDNADIPAGTSWSIVDSTGNTVQEGVLAEALTDGSVLPITSPLEFDVYTLVVDADGYHPVTMELSLIDPSLTEMTFTVDLVADSLPVPDPDPQPEPEPEPVVPAPKPSPDDKKPAPITKLPETGAGENRAPAMATLLMVGSVVMLAGGFLLRIRYQSIRS